MNLNILKRYFVVTLHALLFTLHAHEAHAISIITGPTLTGSPVTSETNPLTNGVTIQLTLDTAGQVQITFSQVSPVDSSLTQVGSVIQTNIAGGVSTKVSWNALWLIGTDLARHDGTFVYQVTPSTGGTSGTPLPATGDPAGLFTINSVDVHNVSVTPSFDASQLSTFPITIFYRLAKDSLVNMTVVNSSGSVVRTLIANKVRLGEGSNQATNSKMWDGLDDGGTPVPLGTYGFRISATDSSTGDVSILRTSSATVQSLAGIAIDSQKLFEQNVFVYPNPVRNGQGTFQMEAIRDGANLSLKIYTITGTLVREQSFPGTPEGNIVSFIWDATNQSGNKVGRGLYYYVVREDDPIGTLQTVKKMAVLP